MLTTYQAPYRASLLATLVLLLTLIQGTSFTLTVAFRLEAGTGPITSFVTLAWLLSYLLALLGLVMTFGVNWLTWLVRYRLTLTLVLAGVAFSALWSLDTELTIERSIHLIGSTIIAFYIGFSLPLARLLKLSGLVLGFLMVISALTALTFPAWGLEEYEGRQVWRGMLASKNTLGFWATISILLFATLAGWSQPLLNRCIYFALLIVSIVCLAFSVSATSALSLLIAAMVMIYLHLAFSLRLGLIAMFVLGVLVCALAGIAFYYIDTAELIGRSGDLTGRGEVWKQTWELILEKPLTGYGYGTIWYPVDESVWIQKQLTDFTWIVFHAHNGLLQVASEIGLPLTILTLFMIFQQLIEIVYCQYQRQQQGVLFVLGFTVALLVSNYSEARLLVNRELFWIFFVALPISMLQQVTVISNNAGFNPVPKPISPRTLEKVNVGRSQVMQRRALKGRLKQRRSNVIIDNEAVGEIKPNHRSGGNS